jgi:hypothetical protein
LEKWQQNANAFKYQSKRTASEAEGCGFDPRRAQRLHAADVRCHPSSEKG